MHDPCDNCNKPCCVNCEYIESTEYKTPCEQFTDNLKISWDYAITKLQEQNPNSIVQELIFDYWKGCDHNDYKIRQYAIKNILEVLNNGNKQRKL